MIEHWCTHTRMAWPKDRTYPVCRLCGDPMVWTADGWRHKPLNLAGEPR